ncbi:hypothetical protein CDO52_00165 [Nocardiopsis gilva YIM 90087]|uniref:Uncharacterized protein n=1 Tax=Nocardiopsis gilva YIM 90087 TaxID=1235441 RepID=A0A223RZT5_9ACTN|nr:hypothetical protein [Nocardiopsis gilva]ASU81402.1 hypothetical protein CDO52_00165 [Nocardiopsis gilva YIM 90087]
MAGPGGRTVGRVNIRVAPDTSRFKADLSKALTRLERTLTVNIPTKLDAGRITADAIRIKRDLQRQLDGVAIGLDVNATRAAADLARVARDRTAEITVDVDRSALSRARSALGAVGRGVAGAGGRAVGLSALVGVISSLGASAAVAAGQVVQLGAALAPITGITAALPAAVAAAGAALGTLQVATLGVGDAFAALASGDTEKFTEALEDLSPAARSVLREVEALSPALGDLQQQAQEALFAPLAGDLTKLGERLLPTLSAGMADVADAMGTAASSVLEFAGSAQSLDFLDELFDSTATAIRNADSALPDFLSGLTALGSAGLPYIEGLGTAIDNAAARFRAWANDAAESGRAVEWIDGAIEVFGQLGDIAGNVGSILGSVFGAAGDGGLLTIIEQATSAMARFLESAEGTQALSGIFQGLSDLGAALSPVLQALLSGIGALAPAVGNIATAFGPVLTSAINGLVPALSALEPGITAVIGALGEGIDALVSSGALEQLGTALADILIAVAPLLPVVGELAALLVGVLAEALTAIAPGLALITAELAESLAPVLPELAAAFNELIQAAAPLVPDIIEALLPLLPLLPDLLVMIAAQTAAWAQVIRDLQPALSELIKGAGTLVGAVATVISWVLDAATSFYQWMASAKETGQRVGQAARSLRDRTVGALANLRDRATAIVTRFRDRLVGAFRSARDRAVGAANGLRRGVTSAISSAVDTVRSLPSRVRAYFGGARSWLKNAGLKIVHGLMDGINDAVSALWDQMSDIAQGVREYWPFSPAKRGPLRTHPMDRAGRTIASMLADGMRQGEALVTRASSQLAAVAIPDLAPEAAAGTRGTPAAEAASLRPLVAAVEALAGRDVVLTVDGQEIARATQRGARQLARR